MKRRRLQSFVWPLALLVAAGLAGLLAEATARSVETVALFGLFRMVGDLVLAIGLVWLLVGLVRIATPARR